MSIKNNKKLVTVYSVFTIVFLLLFCIFWLPQNSNVFKNDDHLVLDMIYAMDDAVERKDALRSFWGRKITHEVFHSMFGIKITDEGISDYILQSGSASGSREAMATAFFLGSQPDFSREIQVARVGEKYDKYFINKGDVEVDKSKVVLSVISQFSPSIGFDFNGVYLIDRAGMVYADFNGIQIPVDIESEILKNILLEIKPVPNKLNMRISLL